MSGGPEQYYRQRLSDPGILPDPAQETAVQALEQLYRALLQAPPRRRRFTLPWSAARAPAPSATGLYLWGGVGRGKTWLVDIFFNQLPIEDKLRLHFHQLMARAHERLATLQGQPDPLDRVAGELATGARVICLDEFIVSDIGDAMILAGLLRALFRRGVTLVTTSNTRPDDLYRDGIQRASFLPAIALLKRHTRVLELGGGTDYRLRYLEQAPVYHTPLDAGVEQALEQEFERLAPEPGRRNGHIHVAHRDIPVRRVADDLVWFDFTALCGPPRSQADYLELARRFHTVMISDIPLLGPALDDATRRFLYLIDAFYDRGVKLIISAAETPDALYQGERLAFDFQRASSRLREMQSTDYLSREHRP